MITRLFIPVCLLMVLFSCSRKKAVPAAAINELVGSSFGAKSIDPPFIPPLRYGNDTIICPVSPSPQFPGGDEALAAFLKKNLEYPEEALRQQKSGIVIVGFRIDEKGKLSHFEVKGRRIGFGLEEEALRVVKLMPDWVHNQLSDAPSALWFIMPIRFPYPEQNR